MPASQKVNFLFQKYVTRGVNLSDQYFSDKLAHACDHLRFFKQYGKTEGFKALELGSGWYPVIPMALYLAGAEGIISIDISPLMKPEGILETIKTYLKWYDAGKLEKLKPYIKTERLKDLRNWNLENLSTEDLLRKLHLQLLIKDARDTGFKKDFFDLICSNNTYEHIYPEILKSIIKEFQRIVKPGGINSHFIDMSDHFAHLDQSITIYNYLRYSEKQWKRIDNSVQPQNRLRLSDYKKMYDNLDITILAEEHRPGSMEDLKIVKLARPFAEYNPDDVVISHAHLVSSK